MSALLDPSNIQPERKVSRTQLAELKACPKCGGELAGGFGLAFGGFGSYKYCEADGCDFAAKAEAEDGS